MKNYNDFINSRQYDIDIKYQMDEGLFDMFKKLFGKIKQTYASIKGGNEIKAISDKYKKLIQDAIEKQASVTLNMGAGDGVPVKESKSLINIKNYYQFINEINEVGAVNGLTEEADTAQGVQSGATSGETATNAKMTVDTLKKKSVLIDQIVTNLLAKAIKEMTQVVTKYGGAEKNPKLQVLLTNSIDQLKLDVMQAKIEMLEKAGDKTIIVKIKQDRDKLSKDLTNRWNTINKAGDVEAGGQLVIGMYYRYNTDSGVKTIKITKQSSIKGKIFATYLVAKDGKLVEQEFRLENIDMEFKPVVGTQYNYYSETSKKVVPVTVEAFDEETKVLTLKGTGGTFKGHLGALRDVVGDTTTETPDETTTAPAATTTTPEAPTTESGTTTA